MQTRKKSTDETFGWRRFSGYFQPSGALIFCMCKYQIFFSRGNQRERDRERAAARAKAGKNKDDGLTPEQRRERDAKALQEKQAKKAAGAAGGNSAGGNKTK
ncbi:hypothetical protein D8674_025340 [Pyrus ussuriensis x Pyrus communis]|uniref:Small EDRK-rich factor-like N-terminal domain-containing protein n=1 Tax=Pyrus ussuriensis x Pyrus communis TaxID=2448454 RepID=A0A5N5H6D0_9ROSA|nr:hypothetical protein D8674_025340 [Pyrus ussuriensis x Pyrus communis]